MCIADARLGVERAFCTAASRRAAEPTDRRGEAICATPVPFEFLLAVLATWRVAFMLTQEDGPWDIFASLRRVSAGTMIGRALDCFYCTSVWVAAPFALWVTPFTSVSVVATAVTWLALSGAACLLYRVTTRTLDVTPLDP